MDTVTQFGANEYPASFSNVLVETHIRRCDVRSQPSSPFFRISLARYQGHPFVGVPIGFSRRSSSVQLGKLENRRPSAYQNPNWRINDCFSPRETCVDG